MSKLIKEGKEADLSSELLQFYDEFSTFQSDCAFLCDAFARLAANNECLDERSIQGLERHAEWLKRRIGEFKENLKMIRSQHPGLPS